MRQRIKSRKGTIMTTVVLPPNLHRRLVLAAIDENAAAAECIRRAVVEWLDRRERRRSGRVER